MIGFWKKKRLIYNFGYDRLIMINDLFGLTEHNRGRVHIAKDKLIEPGKAIFQILISWRQGFSLTIFYTFRYRLSSIVVLLDYQFQGSVSSVIAMVPIIKQIPKNAKNQFIEPRIKPSNSLFSTAGSCLDRTLCFSVLTLLHCQSHARLSILRLGECLFRNFYTPSINLIDCEGHISGPSESTITIFWHRPCALKTSTSP